MNEDIIVIFVTAANQQEAELITSALVEKKLIACGSMVSPVFSIFRWQGKINHEHEVLMILKTRRSKFNEVALEIKALHSYETPEIIALPIIAGADDYVAWVNSET
ncbi:MAG: divalent-cation tolerance protein CutA [Candidatus Zhuqueibacterota bacterium]